MPRGIYFDRDFYFDTVILRMGLDVTSCSWK